MAEIPPEPLAIERVPVLWMKSTDPEPEASGKYREIAAALRRLADRLRAGHQGRERLLALAQQFDRLAEGVGEGQSQ
ncbi:MAG: hypothetical protein JO213_14960 [Alphaproteobacteria bacterium]|nr:hypothetical protein [Alphaproteobacteria bacterium]MBV9586174.1 hypothetical protein [Alphaproteobacteria bacterium]MBV9964374.1 hypothetical protein [Alphaproteobacteria bacterium]